MNIVSHFFQDNGISIPEDYIPLSSVCSLSDVTVPEILECQAWLDLLDTISEAESISSDELCIYVKALDRTEFFVHPQLALFALMLHNPEFAYTSNKFVYLMVENKACSSKFLDDMVRSMRQPVVRKPKEKCIYVIGSKDSIHVKIGIATDPKTRLKALQVANPLPLSIFYTSWLMECAERIESDCHTKLWKYHTVGEWFSCSPKIAIKAVETAIAFYSR